MEYLIASTDGGVIELNDGVIRPKPHHAAVIRDMLASISRTSPGSAPAPPRPVLPQSYVPRWSHVLLAMAYQSLIRQLRNKDPSLANFEARYLVSSLC
jgi:hypothetical protein